MPDIIKNGYLYIAVSPLFALKNKSGKVKQYIYIQEELDNTDTSGYDVQRYKGLGELNPDQLWDTTLNPEHRKLIQVTNEDIEENSSCVHICMSKDVDSRRQFIMTYANM
jgi:DNA gyrase subunit B